jgi:predicted cupin superfamily sugar epimerase
MTKDDLIKTLKLVEHVEGGYFKETYRSPIQVATDRDGGERSISTIIYYLLTKERSVGHFHRNKSDIVHYFHLGSPVTYVLLSPEGNLREVVMGADVEKGEALQLMVPGGTWKASVLRSGEFGLISESVSPGFDFRDMELATPNKFRETFPDRWDEIAELVHPARS